VTPTITHGRQIVRANIGPVGELTPSPAIRTTQPGQVFEGLDIVGALDVRHDVTLVNCRITGLADAPSAGYTIKHQRNVGAMLTLRNCEVITRSPVTRCLVSWGLGWIDAEDTLFAGGTDNVFLKPASPAPGGGFAHRFTRCWFGDVQRVPSSHSDCIQIDGCGGGVLVDRCAITSYALPTGTDPTTAEATADYRASGGIILTYPSSGIEPISRVYVLDSYLDGGNNTLDVRPPDGPLPTDVVISGNQFGLHHTYNPLLYRDGQYAVGNVWAESGVTTTGRTVTAGEPVG
jgi:hypothetical protein